jgi:multiple sugar transport system permease protein
MQAGQPARHRGALAVLALPAVAFTLLLITFPFAYTVWLSFRRVELGGGDRFVGAENYTHLAVDGEFWNGLKVSIILYLLSLVLQLVIGVYLAVLLFEARKMPGVLRSLLVSPFMMPPVVIAMMFLVILDPAIGAANYLLQSLGLPPSDWLASPQWVVPTIALIDTWQWAPYVALIVLGGLQSVPPSVYEAAEIDGAPRWKTFRRITLPLLLPTLVTATILRSVDLLRFFDIIYITTQGGPGNASDALNVYGFHIGFELFQFGYASALAIVLTAAVFGTVLGLNRLRQAVAW